jgi:hypothetical protein
VIFQHTISKVLSGEKTQTRRIVKPDEILLDADDIYTSGVYASIGGGKYRNIYVVGKDYAVQPGRGKSAVARIRVTGLRREDVREISGIDIKAEGFSSYRDFMWTWISMHDKSHARMIEQNELNTDFGVNHRPAEFYDAWVIEFELCKEAQP